MLPPRDWQVVVNLQRWEAEMAVGVGGRRVINAAYGDLTPSFSYNGGAGFDQHIAGAIAECALAKHLGVFWSGTNGTFRSIADVGSRIEVRWNNGLWNPRSEEPMLKIREKDADDAVVVLVSGVLPRMIVRGYIEAREAKIAEYRWEGSKPWCWWVPHEALRPIGDLYGGGPIF